MLFRMPFLTFQRHLPKRQQQHKNKSFQNQDRLEFLANILTLVNIFYTYNILTLSIGDITEHLYAEGISGISRDILEVRRSLFLFVVVVGEGKYFSFSPEITLKLS